MADLARTDNPLAVKEDKTSDVAAAQAEALIKKPASKGERLFNWSVYSGINYWVNLASSLVIADYFINKSGKQHLEKGAEKLSAMVSGGNAVAAEKAMHHSRTALKTLSLLSGGWLLLVPMKYLEDNKRPIVHWLNEKLGVDQRAPDGHKETADEIYIEQEQPKQSWLNVIKRRVLATAAVMATGTIVNEVGRDRTKTAAYKNSPHCNAEEDPHGGKRRFEEWAVDKANKGLNMIGAGVLTKDPNSAFQRYLGLAALDTFFTKITAFVMKATNGAKKVRMPSEIGDPGSPPGIDTRDDVIVTPPTEEVAALSDMHRKRVTSHARHADTFKPNKIVPTESYAELARHGDQAPALG